MFPIPSILLAAQEAGGGDIALPSTSNIFETTLWPSSLTLGWELTRAGTLRVNTNLGWVVVSTIHWMAEDDRTSTIGDEYEYYATYSGDALTVSGVLDAWTTLDADATWQLDVAGKNVTKEGDLTLQVRRISNPADTTVEMSSNIHGEVTF